MASNVAVEVARLWAPDNLRKWVDDPQRIKPGCLMPSMKLTDTQLNGVISYLESLR